MDDDDELCLCFHVTKRKVKNYIRIHRPRFASQLSECGGAGTGCGWCRRLIERLVDESFHSNQLHQPWPDAATHAAGRQQHLSQQSPPKE